MRKRKVLAALIMGGLTSALFGGMVSAADSSNVTTLDEVVINSDRYNDSSVMPGGKTDRKIHFGIYGDTDYMEVPANINSYTDKTIKQRDFYLAGHFLMQLQIIRPSVLVGHLPIIT